MRPPFLLISSRPEQRAADDEHSAVARHMGVPVERVVRLSATDDAYAPPDPAAFAGVLQGGSPFTGSTPLEEQSDLQRRTEDRLGAVLDQVVAAGVPFMGLCYAVGTLTRRLGAVVDHTYGRGTSAVRVELTEAGRTDPLLADVPVAFDAYVGHHEAVTVAPPGSVVLATSDPTPVQMLRVGADQYVTQFHPELDTAGLVRRMTDYLHSGYFPAEEFERVVAEISRVRVDDAHGVLAAFARRYG
ncbi:glutamine amidotransferase [Georgenia sp. Z1491]|uniref:glutamine amidotransferase n=1 Tax=Georgenia sp. Z1491 TaxID=3416707 RepID=UPI003CE6EB4D